MIIVTIVVGQMLASMYGDVLLQRQDESWKHAASVAARCRV